MAYSVDGLFDRRLMDVLQCCCPAIVDVALVGVGGFGQPHCCVRSETALLSSSAIARLHCQLRLVHVRRCCGSTSIGTLPGSRLVFGCLNIRSIANKLDSLRRDQQIDVLFLVETWHDGDSVSLRCLRADGFQVDRPRPRSRADTLATNHGGVAAVAAAGVRLTRLDVGAKPMTFELLCVRVASGTLSMVVAVIYRPGSAAVTSAFFVELADVLDRFGTLAEPVQLVGDVNIRLEWPADRATGELIDVLAAHGLVVCVSGATHDCGGTLDIVAARDDLSLPNVEVLDVGLSDTGCCDGRRRCLGRRRSTFVRLVGHGRSSINAPSAQLYSRPRCAAPNGGPS